MIEDGFYWVKLVDGEDEWTIAEFTNDKWWVVGDNEDWKRDEIHEVGPKIEQPK